jgi:hypothetical protein
MPIEVFDGSSTSDNAVWSAGLQLPWLECRHADQRILVDLGLHLPLNRQSDTYAREGIQAMTGHPKHTEKTLHRDCRGFGDRRNNGNPRPFPYKPDRDRLST